jgi:uncharacterized protein (TIGR03435 family)
MLLAQTNAAPGATPSPAPSFDVATIKPHTAGTRTSWIGITNTPDGVDASSITLTMLMQYAYGLKTLDQVSGAPDWAKTEHFDLQAKMSAEDIAQMKNLSFAEATARREPMMQALLAERFKLKVHTETKQVRVYDLIVAKGSSKLRDAATDPNTAMGKDGKPSTGIRFLKDTSNVMAYSMTSLADFLSSPAAGVGRPVLDKTGLTGTYNFTINWSVYSAQIMIRDGVAVGSAAGDDAPSIFGALQEVGLKLQPSTGPIETIVIDHVDHPTAD